MTGIYIWIYKTSAKFSVNKLQGILKQIYTHEKRQKNNLTFAINKTTKLDIARTQNERLLDTRSITTKIYRLNMLQGANKFLNKGEETTMTCNLIFKTLKRNVGTSN